MKTHRTLRLTRQITPQKMVRVTLIFWAFLLVFAWIVLRQPGVALIPLFSLYPGKVANYGAELIWAVGSGLVFLALAYVGLFRKSKVAAFAFMVLFFTSIVVSLLRFH